VDLHLLVDTVKVFLGDIGDFNDFTSVDLLGGVDSRPDSLLLCTIDILKQVGGELCLANFTVLARA